MPSVARWRRILGQRAMYAFRYRPGDSLAELGITATRASTALQRDQNGIWQTANTNVLRDAHWQYDTLLGRSVRTLLREGASTNSALGSSNFGITTYWSNGSAMTLAAATSCIAGQTATKHTTNSVSPRREQTIGTFVNGQTDCYAVILENVDAAVSGIVVRDLTALGNLALAEFTWATHTAAITGGSGTTGAVDLGNGRYLFWLAATGTAAGVGAAGNSRAFWLQPVVGGSGISVIVHHAQFEAATAVPSSPIVTVAGAVTRAADLISVPWTRNPEAGTWYVDAYDLMGAATGLAPSVIAITDSGWSGDYGIIYKSSGKYRNRLKMAAGTSDSTAAAGASFGDRVELRGFATVSGGNVTATLGQSINNAAEAVAAAGTARAIDAAWPASSRLYIGIETLGATYTANLAIRSLCYVPGPEQSMAGMRQIGGT